MTTALKTRVEIYTNALRGEEPSNLAQHITCLDLARMGIEHLDRRDPVAARRTAEIARREIGVAL
jgi:hypothetical protein